MELLSNINGKKIVIFGTGNFSKNIITRYKLSVKYFVDNNTLKWGKKFYRKEIKNPIKLNEECKDEIRIIVASEAFPQIADQLLMMGFQENVHFFNGIDLLINYQNNYSTFKSKVKHFIRNYKFLIKLYYFFNRDFDRELIATFEGINKPNINDFRRDIHRIEKGLLNKNKKSVFALDYIDKTVKIYYQLSTNNTADENLKKWAYDVLCKYFETVRLTYHLMGLKEEFIEKTKKTEGGSSEHIPYKRKNIEAPVKIEQLYALSKYRRSVRYFEKKTVPREIIDESIRVALQSPSACNRQPFKFRIFDDPKLLKELKKLPLGIKGFEDSIPVLVVVIGDLSSYFDERDRHLIYIDSSLAVMSFIYALETQKVSSCILNWADIEEREVKMEKLLGLESYERPIMMIALGYPDHDKLVAYSAKKELDMIRSYNNE
ncbi:nitroreductase family protein [Robertmurraya sp. DFI.2.37]|uniref:nitroreductase family protein n=1 Tax=Robertmurraya sp. DFI.2.37 TaxID=3031819 RepID=UPI001248F559|nr:nitroreductase family protein [Robertmurraya sp. DFI.2.37]MDF1507836.1 nitroreductase family protein [Robertmurraya sp. DFI.2.37]